MNGAKLLILLGLGSDFWFFRSFQQVSIIFSRLEEAPKLYETEEMKIKEVAVKLFYGAFTLYVVEFNSSDRLAFGYMKNEADGYLSEWGYSSIDKLIKLGFEMDLYFENRVIDSKGKVFDKEVLDV
jgi:hypothetical protein